MKYRPILFTTDMVRAILDSRKTQTRRIKYNCEVGDVLWIRETWRVSEVFGKTTEGNFQISVKFKDGTTGYVTFTPDRYKKFKKFIDAPKKWHTVRRKWISSIFMPREACRLYLQVENVWEEKIQDISPICICMEGIKDIFEEKYRKEGRFLSNGVHTILLTGVFAELWNSINAKRGFGWDKNPIVKVIEFRRVERLTKGGNQWVS